MVWSFHDAIGEEIDSISIYALVLFVKKYPMKITRHVPVLLPEVIAALPKQGYFLDGTLGHGGHMQARLTQDRPL